MTDQKDNSRSEFSSVPFDVSSMFDAHKSGMETWQRFHASYMENVTAYHGEVLGLVNRRVKRGLDMFGLYANCSTPQDLYSAHVEASQSVVSHYVEDVSRFSELGSRVVADVVNGTGEGADSVMPKKGKKKSNSDE